MKSWYSVRNKTIKHLSFSLIIGVLFISTIGCEKIETREKTLPDSNSTGKILSEKKTEPLEGYIYDEQTGRYINEITGIWYVVENGYKVIPPEEYFDHEEVGIPSGINISNRPNDVWKLKEIREITVQPGDTLVDIINPYFMNEHFRMDYEWYAKQVLELNNFADPHFIKAGDTLKIPIYIDKEAK